MSSQASAIFQAGSEVFPAGICRMQVWQGQPFSCLDRLLTSTGVYATPTNINAIAYTVWDLRQIPATEIASGSLTPANVLFATLQTGDKRWVIDAVGYNFLAPMAGLPNGPQDYRIEIQFTETTGGKTFQAVYWPTTQLVL